MKQKKTLIRILAVLGLFFILVSCSLSSVNHRISKESSSQDSGAQALAAPKSSVRNDSSALVTSAPFAPFVSEGDMWFSTWDDKDDVFVTWGDGYGPTTSSGSNPNSFPSQTHNGLALLHGTLPNVTFEVVNRNMPFAGNDRKGVEDKYNSKTSSLLFLEGRLYAAIHHPLVNPNYGFIAYSDDYGKTFQFPPAGDTWKKGSKFLSRVFLNMGQAYGLDTDGYVYVYGMVSEIETNGLVYLARVLKSNLKSDPLHYNTWQYFTGLDSMRQPKWDASENNAQPLSGVISRNIFSAIYHPGSQQYFILTAELLNGNLFKAAQPWGPWTSMGKWFDVESNLNTAWGGSYMPGMITKDLGAGSFYFACGGSEPPGFPGGPLAQNYRFRLGLMALPGH